MRPTPTNSHFERGGRLSWPAASGRASLVALLVLLCGQLVSLAAPAAESAAGSTCPTFRIREQDQVWLVSTRHLGCSGGKWQPALQAWRYQNGVWQPASLAEFY